MMVTMVCCWLGFHGFYGEDISGVIDNCLEGKHCYCLCVDRVGHILLTMWYVKSCSFSLR